MVISTKAASEMESDTGLERESIWMDLSIQGSILRTNLMARVGNYLFLYSNLIGLYIWRDGERYEGEWGEGKFHGKGIKTLPDGTIFDGDWQYGRPVG